MISTLAHYSNIVSDMSFGSVYGIYSDIRSEILLFRHTFWHRFWHSFWEFGSSTVGWRHGVRVQAELAGGGRRRRGWVAPWLKSRDPHLAVTLAGGEQPKDNKPGRPCGVLESWLADLRVPWRSGCGYLIEIHRIRERECYKDIEVPYIWFIWFKGDGCIPLFSCLNPLHVII